MSAANGDRNVPGHDSASVQVILHVSVLRGGPKRSGRPPFVCERLAGIPKVSLGRAFFVNFGVHRDHVVAERSRPSLLMWSLNL